MELRVGGEEQQNDYFVVQKSILIVTEAHSLVPSAIISSLKEDVEHDDKSSCIYVGSRSRKT